MSTLKQLVDETSNIKNELKTCHDNLKSNLSSKGIYVDSTDKMQTLIDKINNIHLGRKWASGSATTQYDTQVAYLEVKNLGFTPSVVLVNGGGWWSEFHPYFNLKNTTYGMTKLNTTTDITSGNGLFIVSTTTNNPSHWGRSYTYNNAFRIVHTTKTNTSSVTWIAYE